MIRVVSHIQWKGMIKKAEKYWMEYPIWVALLHLFSISNAVHPFIRNSCIFTLLILFASFFFYFSTIFLSLLEPFLFQLLCTIFIFVIHRSEVSIDCVRIKRKSETILCMLGVCARVLSDELNPNSFEHEYLVNWIGWLHSVCKITAGHKLNPMNSDEFFYRR